MPSPTCKPLVSSENVLSCVELFGDWLYSMYSLYWSPILIYCELCGCCDLTIIIIMLAYLYCAAYTQMTMNESSPPSEHRRITFNDDGQRVQFARPELPAPHYIYMYRLLPTTPPPLPHHLSGIITPTYFRYQFTDPERMDSMFS